MLYQCPVCKQFLEWKDGQWVCPKGCIVTISQSDSAELIVESHDSYDDCIETAHTIKNGAKLK